MYVQDYDPLRNGALSTLAAAIPICSLLYFMAVHPHRDANGHRHFGVSAPRAAFAGVAAAFAVAILVMRMPATAALSAFAFGALSGSIGIVWIVVAAIFLHTITLVSGTFVLVQRSIVQVTFDRRLQLMLIVFSFGAIMEGTAGSGAPVAIGGAMLVGLGFAPFQAAVLNLLANTAAVTFGAIGAPVVTLAAVSGLDETALSTMAGRQLPFAAMLIAFWVVVTFVRMEGGGWREAFAVWPAVLVAGGSFAAVLSLVSSSAPFHLLTDVVAGVASVLAVILFLRVWRPASRFPAATPSGPAVAARASATGGPIAPGDPPALSALIGAWIPWGLLILCVGLWSWPGVKGALDGLFSSIAFDATVLGVHVGGTLSRPVFDMPALHLLVRRGPPVAAPDGRPESAQLVVNYLSAPGTGVLAAAILSATYLRLSAAQWRDAIARTARRMRSTVLVFGQLLGLAALARYAGTDVILGLAFTASGTLYPFFAAYVGWLGVFLTGSDTASNALFGGIQRITAERLSLEPVLIVTANSTGGVMGKMIAAQNIAVAAASCYEDPAAGARALGPIFRTVVWHSLALTGLVGILVALQAHVLRWMVAGP